MRYTATDESDLVFDLDDGKKIHGVLRGGINTESKLVVIMHGLFGGPKKSILTYLASRYLHDHGYITLSLYMYDSHEQYRDIVDCSLETHIGDFEQVIHQLHSEFSCKLFAAGHSFGGLTILGSRVKLDGAVLWDPSHGLAWSGDQPLDRWNGESAQFLTSNRGRGDMRPKILQSQLEELGDTSTWARDIAYPTKIITGDQSVIYKYVPRYYDELKVKKDLVVIRGAGHSFNEQDVHMERLLAETVEWFDSL